MTNPLSWLLPQPLKPDNPQAWLMANTRQPGGLVPNDDTSPNMPTASRDAGSGTSPNVEAGTSVQGPAQLPGFLDPTKLAGQAEPQAQQPVNQMESMSKTGGGKWASWIEQPGSREFLISTGLQLMAGGWGNVGQQAAQEVNMAVVCFLHPAFETDGEAHAGGDGFEVIFV